MGDGSVSSAAVLWTSPLHIDGAVETSGDCISNLIDVLIRRLRLSTDKS